MSEYEISIDQRAIVLSEIILARIIVPKLLSADNL